jgi:hypothetical protein
MTLLLSRRSSGEDVKKFSKHGTTAFVSTTDLLLLAPSRFLTCHRLAVRDHCVGRHIVLKVELMCVQR